MIKIAVVMVAMLIILTLLNNNTEDFGTEIPTDSYGYDGSNISAYPADTEIPTTDVNGTRHGSYLVSPKEHIGTFLNPHQCVANTQLFDCLKACDIRDKCTGTEWTPLMVAVNDEGEDVMYENVCCPKRDITEITERKSKNSRGRFYVKLTEQQLTDLDGGMDSVTLLR